MNPNAAFKQIKKPRMSKWRCAQCMNPMTVPESYKPNAIPVTCSKCLCKKWLWRGIVKENKEGLYESQEIHEKAQG